MTYSNNIPSYVVVYNALYSDIINNVYEEGEILPSETLLAKKYEVSRNTLRQALAVLNEDGLITKSQGKGTLVTVRNEKEVSQTVFNPMRISCRETVTHIDYLYNFAPPTDIAKEKLHLKQSDLILASNNIYYVDEQAVGFSFIQIPMRTIEKFDVDVSDEKQVEQLIEAEIYSGAVKATMAIKLIYANEMEVEFLGLEPLVPILLSETILLDGSSEPMARCKCYFIPEHYDLHFMI